MIKQKTKFLPIFYYYLIIVTGFSALIFFNFFLKDFKVTNSDLENYEGFISSIIKEKIDTSRSSYLMYRISVGGKEFFLKKENSKYLKKFDEKKIIGQKIEFQIISEDRIPERYYRNTIMGLSINGVEIFNFEQVKKNISGENTFLKWMINILMPVLLMFSFFNKNSMILDMQKRLYPV